MRKFTFKLLIFSFTLLIFGNISAQTDRAWWNTLSPEWKRVIQKQQFKGKDVNPTDEQLLEISKMTFLDLANNKEVKTLKPASQLQILEVIKCNNSSIESLEGIENLINLKELDCSDNDNINSLIPIANLPNLEDLNCGNTMVKSLFPLRGMKKLRKLDLHYTTIVDLRILKDNTAIEYLDVSDNISLYSLDGVNFMFQLRELNCSKTNIDDLTPLSLLPTLERVDCSNTKVFTLRPLQPIKTLTDIDCSDTPINAKSLDYLIGLSRLTMLRCKNIAIEEAEIKFFEGLIQKKNVNATIIITKKVIK